MPQIACASRFAQPRAPPGVHHRVRHPRGVADRGDRGHDDDANIVVAFGDGGGGDGGGGTNKGGTYFLLASFPRQEHSRSLVRPTLFVACDGICACVRIVTPSFGYHRCSDCSPH